MKNNNNKWKGDHNKRSRTTQTPEACAYEAREQERRASTAQVDVGDGRHMTVHRNQRPSPLPSHIQVLIIQHVNSELVRFELPLQMCSVSPTYTERFEVAMCGNELENVIAEVHNMKAVTK